MVKFTWPIRVYYEDTDAAGIVYHANYLRFMERARTEWLRTAGFEQDDLRNSHGIVFVIRDANMRFIQPARFNQQLVVTTELLTLRRVSLEVRQSVHHTDELLCEAVNLIACVAAETLKPKRIPASIIKEFSGGD